MRLRNALALLSRLVLALLGVGVLWAVASPDDVLFAARLIAWGESDVKDYEVFPERVIHNAPPVFAFQSDLTPALFTRLEYTYKGETQQVDFERFLRSTGTTAFIVSKDDKIRYEGYFNGYQRDFIVTSFSAAKSFVSALIGIAIDEGTIKSVNDPMTAYLPELRGKGLDRFTIRQLLNMSSGIAYVEEQRIFPLLIPWSDDAKTYYYPNLRRLALQVKADGEPPGTYFHYNNYHPLLLGMILERATHKPVAEYLQDKLWKPLGMDYPASWSLDSDASGFEKMESGINARAIDFAKFGRLFLNKGNWNGQQLISERWVLESTAPEPEDRRPWHMGSVLGFSDAAYAEYQAGVGYYKYMWWGRLRVDASYDFMARGNYGQYIYVSPVRNMVIVRFGVERGQVDSWQQVLQGVADNFAEEP
jgi:CubicO group peptidase (beta-lactamase class C family)